MAISLGVHNSFTAKSHDSSATLVIDGEIVAAIEEERISRRKSSVGYPASNAIRECLKIANISIEDVSLVVSDGTTYPKMEDKLMSFLKSEYGFSPKVKLINQAQAHSLGSFLSSGFQESLVISVDAVGDKTSTLVSLGSKERRNPKEILNVLYEADENKSLGYFYSAFTQYLGFESLEGEYKVMGMAAYAEPTIDLSQVLHFNALSGQIQSRLGDLYNSSQTSISEYCIDTDAIYNLTKISRRIPKQKFDEKHFELASSVQKTFSDAYIDLIKYWVGKTNAEYLCLAGGCALNALANMELLKLGLKGIYVMPASSDRGVSMGCAQWGSMYLGDQVTPPTNMYLGRQFSDAEIEQELDLCGVRYEKVDDLLGCAALDLEKGFILGWFQGRSEFGPRALGNRSILANPRLSEIKNKLNSKIKFREEFRPFAPAINTEAFIHEDKHKADLSAMTITLKVDPAQSKFFPGGVHNDFSSRVQLVSPKEGIFHSLLKKVGEVSGHPSVINTSFNLRGEPMVDSPSDALRTFFSSGLDALYIGNYKVTK
jgi:carbamoyltransferase